MKKNNIKKLLIGLLLLMTVITLSLIPPSSGKSQISTFSDSTKISSVDKMSSNTLIDSIQTKVRRIDSTHLRIDNRLTKTKLIQDENKKLYAEVIKKHEKRVNDYVKELHKNDSLTIVVRDTIEFKKRFFGLFRKKKIQKISDTIRVININNINKNK